MTTDIIATEAEPHTDAPTDPDTDGTLDTEAEPEDGTDEAAIEEALAEIARHVDVPVITGPQAQGDLIVLPWPAETGAGRRARDLAKVAPIPADGVTVLTGNGGHAHRLAPTPGVAWHAYPGERQTLGVLAVADDATAVLGHIEHGDTHIGPGVYVIRRQREQADEVRLVAD